MATPRFAWGIDVGNRALKAVKLIREGDGLRIDDFELIEHETVLSNAGDNKETLIQNALASFVQRHQIKSGGVVGVGVSGQASFARFIKLPPVETKKIPEIVRFEAIQQIPFPLDDVEWSYQLFQHPDSPDVEVGIFAMRKELVNQHIKYFTDIDLNVQVVQMSPLAVYNALQHDGKFDSGTTMVIDLGAENTDLLIADNETIWMRSIPIGGNNFTETLVKAFKLNFTKAEELKRNAATSKYARQIFQAMRPIFADLVAEIQRSIGFYSSVHRDSRIKKVLALGGTFKLPGLQKYLQQNLSMDVERLDSVTATPPSDPKLVPTFNENLLSVISAYGLALQAIGDTKINSSLLPAHIRREKTWKEKTKWFGAAAALFVLGSGLAGGKYLFQNFQYELSQRNYAEQIDKVKKQASDLDAQWAALEGAGAAERDQMKGIRMLDAYRSMWRNLLADLYGAVPNPKTPTQLSSTNPADVARVLGPRAKRKTLQVEMLSSQFIENIQPIITSGSFNQYAPGMTPPAAPADPSQAPPAPDPSTLQNASIAPASGARGYLITLNCSSPYADALANQGMVEKEFIGKLLAIKPDDKRPHMEYGVARASLTGTPRRIKQDEGKKQQLRSQYDALMRAQAASQPPGTANPETPPGPNWGGGMQPNPQAAIDAEAFKDPLTGESVLDDWQFQVLIAVVIDPNPHQPAAAAPGSPQASAQQ
jgi:type IV pilus assembly protein PilM